MMQTRPPAVAGTFYPAAPRDLEAMVSTMLSRALRGEEAVRGEGEKQEDGGPAPKALIVPHAGYVYSGPVAASAYAKLRRLRGKIRRVVLLGPAHRVAIRGLAAPAASAFETPLGVVEIDHEAIGRLGDLPQVGISDRAHALEHSLEVQLPFLQEMLGEFTLVPLVVGDASDREVAAVIERLWGGDETLIVISSDLSHYYDYETARRMDAESRLAIERLDPAALGEESACGRVPVRGMLRAARSHGLAAQTLDLRSSGDTAGPRDQVVGYGAWALVPIDVSHAGVELREREEAAAPTEHASAAPTERASAAATDRSDALLLALARDAIVSGLESGVAPGVRLAELPPELKRPGASFVTLRSPDGELRGCIGSLEATRPLARDVVENAWAAASRDPRMAPVTRAELATLSIEISVLGPLEPIEARSFDDLVRQLRPGRDGLVLEDRGARGTLLPSVWEQQPDPRAFAGLVWRKAGLPAGHWSGSVRAWRYGVRKLGPA